MNTTERAIIRPDQGWRRYYESSTVDFADHLPAYCAAAKILRGKYPEIFDLNPDPTYVLGGYHPHTKTPETFKKFCRLLSPNCNLVLVDQNSYPLTVYLDDKLDKRVRARLEDFVFLPLQPIDGIFFDRTIEFMSDSQLEKVAEGLGKKLDQNGLAWMVSYIPTIKSYESFLRKLMYGINCYLRKPNEVTKLVEKYLKPVAAVNFEVEIPFHRYESYLLVFASQRSSLVKTEMWQYLPINP